MFGKKQVLLRVVWKYLYR